MRREILKKNDVKKSPPGSIGSAELSSLCHKIDLFSLDE